MKKLLLVVLAAVLVVGCGKKEKEEVNPYLNSSIEDFYKSFFASIESNNTNEAIKQVSLALQVPGFKNDYPELFRSLIVINLRANRDGEAKKLILDAAANNTNLVNSGIGQVCRYYATNYKTNDLLDWTALLIDKNLPSGALGTAYSWRMEALYQAGELNEIMALVPSVINKIRSENAVYIMRRLSRDFLRKGEYDKQAELLKMISDSATGNSAIESFVVSANISALLAKKNVEAAEALFREQMAVMDDSDLAASFSGIKNQLKAKNIDTGKISAYVLKNVKDKPRTIKSAATEWVAVPAADKQYILAINRFNELIKMNIDPNAILKIYLAQFYKVTSGGDKNIISKMMSVGDALMEKVDENGAKSIGALQLDGSFLMEDYVAAAKYIKGGIEGHDEAWHKMALNKVNAHQALKEGRIEDAIAGFRRFMDTISEDAEGEVDPATGIVYSKDMMLGLNALRIGDLYKSIGKKKESAEAYDEAGDYYTQALSAVKPESKEYALIQEKIKQLPASTKGK